ncbi:MAG: peptidylprolyl isomerase [Omnitrophica bacterium]|nr:peptidylprolyl isomerase [Candidatus Omnitrophota bacterium]
MNIKMVHIFVGIVFVLALNNGCAKRNNEKVLATINEIEEITLGEFNEIISKLPARYQDVVSKNQRVFLDELIVDRLLFNEAMAKKLDQKEEVRRLFKEAKKKIVMARLLKDEVEDKVVVDEAEIKDYYSANKYRFATQESLRASHILVRSQEEADSILAELSSGKNFEDLARARSIDPTSEAGGDIGYFTRTQLVPEFEDACFDMKVDEISGVVKTKFGYHIIKLTERTKPEAKELVEVRDSIEQALSRLKKKIRFNKLVSRLKENAQITVNANLLESISPGENPEEN